MTDTNTTLTRSAAWNRWSTSSFGGSANASPADLASLEMHLRRSYRERDRLFGLKCAGEALDAFAAPRIVTTFVLAALVGAALYLLG